MSTRLTWNYDPESTKGFTFLDNVPSLKRKKGEPKVKDSYFELDASDFKVRGKTYMKDSEKKPSKESAFELVSFQMINSIHKLYHVSENLASLREFLSSYPDDFFFVAVRLLPTTPKITAITVTRRRKRVEGEDSPDDESFENLLRKFFDGDDKFRDQRLKYIPKLANGPWIALTALKALGGERPVLTGNGYLKQLHFKGENYYEVDIDIASSYVARKITSSVMNYLSAFRISECFVIQGQGEDELPERAICAYGCIGISTRQGCATLTAQDEDFFKTNPFPETKK